MTRYLPDFAGVLCVAIFLIRLVTTGGDLLRDGDSFWHIKAGSVMLDQQALITSDIFSHTAADTPWTAHEWLSEIIMASVHNMAGLEGVICFFVLIAALTFWILYKTTESCSSQWVAFGCVAVALLFSPMHMAARPHMFTWLFMVTTVAILIKGNKWLYWLPPMMVIWANLHGGFIISLVLQGVFLCGAVLDQRLSTKTSFSDILSQQKRPVIVLLLCVLACGLNPFGYALLAFPFQVSKGVFSLMINEWKAPDLQSLWYFRFYILAIAILISFSRSAVTWTERLLILFFLNAALTHSRHISLMLLALTPFTARMIEQHLSGWSRKGSFTSKGKQLRLSPSSGPLATIFLTLCLLALGSVDPGSLRILAPAKVIDVETTQVKELTEYLENDLPRGKMFNEYVLGGYLLYALEPPPKVFIDGRADMYGEQIMSDYSDILTSPSKREELLEQYDINWVVFEKNSDLVKALSNSGEWKSTYANEYYEVLTKTPTEKISQEIMY
jgi:hypothetical protein